MTDYKQLCEELADNLHRYQCWYIEDNGCSLHELEALLCRADAALAEPEPEGPTDEELMKLLPEDLHKEFANWSRIYAEHAGIKPGLFRVVLNTHAVDFARTVLARWGNHPGSPDSSTQPS